MTHVLGFLAVLLVLWLLGRLRRAVRRRAWLRTRREHRNNERRFGRW